MMRYGVQYQPLSGRIEAGTVRKQDDLDVFMTKSDVTMQVLGSAAQYLLAAADHEPVVRVTDRSGVTYELSARIVQ